MTKRKGNNYKFWHSPIALVLLFLVLIYFGYKIIDLIQKERETVHKKELKQDQIIELKEKTEFLLKDISKLEGEEGIEETIRDKYQVAKPGEKMVTIIEDKNKVDSSLENKEESHGFWNWIKGIINK